MALTQETFLGASIRGFNASMGWGNQTSNCTVDLVEDPANGDSFDPPLVGKAVNFDYDQWHFGGLLQSYQRQYGQQGNPVYQVQIVDPRELLAGVQLVLQDYAGGTYGVPNLYNIYGYLEAYYGFGGSQSNDSGIPWYLIRNAFWSLQLTTPIWFRGSYFIFDPFFNIDVLPYYYRIGGDSISALDYVQNICDALACDFTVEMIPYSNSDTSAANLIRIRRIMRNIVPANNAINTFVANVDGAVAKSAGYELSNEVTSRFVVGGKVNNMFYQDKNTYGTSSQYDDTIAPFWGEDAYGRLIVGQGNFNDPDDPTGKGYQFMLDGRPLYLTTGQSSLIFYYTDLAEMRAARAGQESWEAFLAFHNYIPTSIHFNKANILGITDSTLSQELFTLLSNAKSSGASALPKRAAIKNADTSPDGLRRASLANEGTRKRIAKVYNYIRQYATEYYGKKFMVRVPFVAGTWVPDTSTIKLSMIPVSTGYVPEENWGTAIYYGYLPFNPEKFTDGQNKLYPYAGFAGMSDTSKGDVRSKFAFDRLSPESYILDQYPNQSLGQMRENLFVKGQVAESLVFVNKSTLFSPRAVITLDGPIQDNDKSTDVHSTMLLDELAVWLAESPTSLSNTEILDWTKEFGMLSGQDWTWHAKEANYRIPDMCAIPLESQILRYGPWYYSNTAGKVEFENDSSLVPWNFGSFTAMNLAGWSKVNSAITSQQSHEQGQIEFPGVPTLSLGSALINGGPFVTDVNVQVSEAGVTTTYRMNTWNWQFGRLGKYNVERFAQLSKVAQQQRKAFRQFYGYAQPISLTAQQQQAGVAPKAEPSVMTISGEVNVENPEDEANKTAKPNAAGQTLRTMKRCVDDDNYVNKAGISMDGIFVPYSTKPDSVSNLPKFVVPTSSGTPVNTDLIPFGADSVGAVYQDTADGSLPTNLTKDDSEEVKAMAIRAPIIVGGWGYDTSGKPVPSGDAGEFYPNYKSRADKWKVGPLDIRWNEAKGTWDASGGSGGGLYFGVVLENIGYAGSGQVKLKTFDESAGVDAETKPFADGDEVLAYEYILGYGDVLFQDTEVVLTKDGDNYIIVGSMETCGG